eukprot:Platyproteum_vivax@DN56_c0_g1_i1.p1
MQVPAPRGCDFDDYETSRTDWLDDFKSDYHSSFLKDTLEENTRLKEYILLSKKTPSEVDSSTSQRVVEDIRESLYGEKISLMNLLEENRRLKDSTMNLTDRPSMSRVESEEENPLPVLPTANFPNMLRGFEDVKAPDFNHKQMSPSHLLTAYQAIWTQLQHAEARLLKETAIRREYEKIIEENGRFKKDLGLRSQKSTNASADISWYQSECSRLAKQLANIEAENTLLKRSWSMRHGLQPCGKETDKDLVRQVQTLKTEKSKLQLQVKSLQKEEKVMKDRYLALHGQATAHLLAYEEMARLWGPKIVRHHRNVSQGGSVYTGITEPFKWRETMRAPSDACFSTASKNLTLSRVQSTSSLKKREEVGRDEEVDNLLTKMESWQVDSPQYPPGPDRFVSQSLAPNIGGGFYGAGELRVQGGVEMRGRNTNNEFVPCLLTLFADRLLVEEKDHDPREIPLNVVLCATFKDFKENPRLNERTLELLLTEEAGGALVCRCPTKKKAEEWVEGINNALQDIQNT